MMIYTILALVKKNSFYYFCFFLFFMLQVKVSSMRGSMADVLKNFIHAGDEHPRTNSRRKYEKRKMVIYAWLGCAITLRLFRNGPCDSFSIQLIASYNNSMTSFLNQSFLETFLQMENPSVIIFIIYLFGEERRLLRKYLMPSCCNVCAYYY